MDWDRMMKNKARTGSFSGHGAEDEDAYYRAFAGGEKRVRLAQMLASADVVVAQVGAVARSAFQAR